MAGTVFLDSTESPTPDSARQTPAHQAPTLGPQLSRLAGQTPQGGRLVSNVSLKFEGPGLKEGQPGTRRTGAAPQWLASPAEGPAGAANRATLPALPRALGTAVAHTPLATARTPRRQTLLLAAPSPRDEGNPRLLRPLPEREETPGTPPEATREPPSVQHYIRNMDNFRLEDLEVLLGSDVLLGGAPGQRSSAAAPKAQEAPLRHPAGVTTKRFSGQLAALPANPSHKAMSQTPAHGTIMAADGSRTRRPGGLKVKDASATTAEQWIRRLGGGSPRPGSGAEQLLGIAASRPPGEQASPRQLPRQPLGRTTALAAPSSARNPLSAKLGRSPSPRSGVHLPVVQI